MIRNRVYGALLRLKGSSPHREYEQIRDALASEEPLQICKNYLGLILQHAYRNVPYYAKALLPVCTGHGASFDDFERIPILTKSIIRQMQSELVSKDINDRRWHYNTSGGSTGEPVRLIQDRTSDKWTNLTTKYYYEDMIGINELAVKKIIIWGSEREIINHKFALRTRILDWLTNTASMNSFRMNRTDMEKHIRVINARKPDLIRGYADSLYQMSRYIAKRGLNVHSPKVVVSAAEKLGKDRRQTIEAVFGTRVYDFYGSREADGIAGECNCRMMHMFMFNNYVEVQPEPTAFETGRVIVTTLHNYSMPLIRYDIGDTATLGPRHCECGNPLPTLAEVTGRVTDHFLTEEGTLVHGEYFTHLFYFKDWVRSFQVIQEDLRRVRILVVAQDPDQGEMNDISSKIRLVMGSECEVIWEIVDEIPESPSGKHLYTKSLVSR
jgi:phenylacetate-CoA ligase